MFPSADTVGRSSGYSVFTFGPRFSILIIVSALITFSFCAINLPVVSFSGCEMADFIPKQRINRKMVFFKAVDFGKSVTKIIEIDAVE